MLFSALLLIFGGENLSLLSRSLSRLGYRLVVYEWGIDELTLGQSKKKLLKSVTWGLIILCLTNVLEDQY